tara:strand:- start:2240 stop:2401 length:162 start_codon:yes stop_codon:yes gene_type:complete
MISYAIMKVGPQVHVGVISWIECEGFQVKLSLGIYVVVTLVAIEIQKLVDRLR